MPVITSVPSTEYRISYLNSIEGEENPSSEILVAENLGEDIAFTLYDLKNKGVCLARNVAIDEIRTIVNRMLAPHTELECGVPVVFFVQFVGGRPVSDSSLLSVDPLADKAITHSKAYRYYEQVLAKFGELAGSKCVDKVFPDRIQKIGDRCIFVINSVDILHKPHPESVSTHARGGLLLPYIKASGSNFDSALMARHFTAIQNQALPVGASPTTQEKDPKENSFKFSQLRISS